MAEPCGRWPAPLLLDERCTGCGLCASACPCGAITLDAAGKPQFACASRCTRDASCVACRGGFHPCQEVCEPQAIQLGFSIRRMAE
jgi:ferredoxin